MIPEDGIVGFMEHCSNRIGEAYFRTPRTTIKSFIDLLAVLEQNEEASWQSLVGKLDITADQDGARIYRQMTMSLHHSSFSRGR